MAYPAPSSHPGCIHDPNGSLSPPCITCSRESRTPIQGPTGDLDLAPVASEFALPEAAVAREEVQLPTQLKRVPTVSGDLDRFGHQQGIDAASFISTVSVSQSGTPKVTLRPAQDDESDSDYYQPCQLLATIPEEGVDAEKTSPSSLSDVAKGKRPAAGNMTSPARDGVSPSSSPRLPSPPPFPEVQIGPKSPSVGDANKGHQLGGDAKPNNAATRRIRPGTKAADMAKGPPLVPLEELDSAFQLQEHMKALYCSVTQNPNSTTKTPVSRAIAKQLAAPPSTPTQTVDKTAWLYELCRFLTVGVNKLICGLQAERPPCSEATCPEMRASEWQYLCAVHDPPKSCAAINYSIHTLDWAGNILTSPKYFPSRLMMGTEQTAGGSNAGMRHLTNIFRRLYRIFAHTWFQHRDVFYKVEGEDGLYTFFKTVCDVYQLIPEDNYTIPQVAELYNIEVETPVSNSGPDLGQLPVIMKRTDDATQSAFAREKYETKEQTEARIADADATEATEAGEATTTVSVGATTRRHKHTPSTGTNVATIAEATEEEEPPVEGMKKLDLSEIIRKPDEAFASPATPMPFEKEPMEDALARSEDAEEEVSKGHQEDNGEKEQGEKKDDDDDNDDDDNDDDDNDDDEEVKTESKDENVIAEASWRSHESS